MTHNFFLVLVILIAFTALGNKQLNAQAVRPISLKEAIDLSIKNSKQLKSSYAKIEEATAALQEAVERKLPEAGISGSYLRLNSPNISVKTKTSSTPTSGTPEEKGKPSSAIYSIANVSLPIYSGSRIKYGIEFSKYLEQATKLDVENNREAVILNTINAYDNLYKSKAAVALLKESLEGNKQRVKDFSNLEKNGLLPRNDLLKAELQEANTELSLLDAENNWKLANISMDIMLGIPDTTTLATNETDLLNVQEQVKVVDDYVGLALQNRKDLEALAYRKKAATTGIKAAKGEMYPSLALTGGYIAANIPNVFNVSNAVNLGLGVQYSLSSLWKNNSKVEQAKAREKQISATENMLNDEVRLEVNQAYQNYLLSRKKIEVHEKAVAQAEENYRIVNNKFINALANTTELLDADLARLQARLNAAFAKADASLVYYKLLQTAGLLNEKEIK